MELKTPMYHGNIDLPTFVYFDFGNVWTGSLLGSFNYRIEPQPKNEPPRLQVSVWYGGECYDKAEIAETFEEEFSAEGYERVIERLNAMIDEYRIKVNSY